MKVAVKITKDEVAKVIAAVKAAAQAQLLVGIPAATAPRPGEPDTNATLGYAHEFGVPSENIPARPFLGPGVTNALPDVIPRLKVAAGRAIEGDSAAVESGMHEAGLAAANAVRAKIVAGPFAPLSQRTIAERRAKGRTGEMKPLINTGKLLASVTYVIRKRRV